MADANRRDWEKRTLVAGVLVSEQTGRPRGIGEIWASMGDYRLQISIKRPVSCSRHLQIGRG